MNKFISTSKPKPSQALPSVGGAQYNPSSTLPPDVLCCSCTGLQNQVQMYYCTQQTEVWVGGVKHNVTGLTGTTSPPPAKPSTIWMLEPSARWMPYYWLTKCCYTSADRASTQNTNMQPAMAGTNQRTHKQF